MGEIAAIGAVALLFAAFALLHRRAAPTSCHDLDTDGCETCAHHTDCLEKNDDVR